MTGFVLIVISGIILTVLLFLGDQMEKLNQAIVRLQASVAAATAKIDALRAAQGVGEDVLNAAADQLNAASDALDAKVNG